tara:strand:- start:950 stop:1141 length:192 start_codon:yes stop_codon:yes gene_type:complete
MSGWISVGDRLPTIEGTTKVRVRIEKGAADKKIVERVVLAKPHMDSVRFMVGDWQRIIDWYEE